MLGRGDVLYLYTDGVKEANNENTGKITEFAERFLTEEDCAPKLVHPIGGFG